MQQAQRQQYKRLYGDAARADSMQLALQSGWRDHLLLQASWQEPPS